MKYKHTPVMLEEAIEYLNINENGLYIDCNLGGGGYTDKILNNLKSNGIIVSVDLDDLAIKNQSAKNKKNKVKNNLLIKDNFSNLEKIAEEHFNKKEVNGIVFDLGLSSAQLDDQERGFSFNNLKSPLDMSFGSQARSTSHIVNVYSQSELTKIISQYGEERFAARIAKDIVNKRITSPIKTVGDLVDIVHGAIPKKFQSRTINPATKTFQALRIKTNHELESLEKALEGALKILSKGGRIVVVSYHSLEDRIVKSFFKQNSQDCICPKSIPVCMCNHEPDLKILTKKPITPSIDELNTNPRSRSAKLRASERV